MRYIQDTDSAPEIDKQVLPTSDPVTNQIIVLEYDGCFGVINTTAMSSFSASQITPLDVSFYGSLDSPVIYLLMDRYKVQLKAQFMPCDSRVETKPKKEDTPSPKRCPVRIVLYGMRDDKTAVGQELSKAGLYLQHPFAYECEEDTEYCNPHYLLRPGSEMPNLEMPLMGGSQSPSMSHPLDEARMSRMLQIFDSVDIETGQVSVAAHPSTRLSCTLMDHQLTALAVMVERECGIAGRLRFPTLWVPGPENQYYQNTITGHRQPRLVPIRGGVLADDMGLGKSLSTLALICSSLDELHSYTARERIASLNATLIVCPKSTLHAWQTQISRHILPGQIKSALYHGPQRQKLASDFGQFDVVLTTYETLRSDWGAKGPLFAEKWFRVVLDEAHHIRNRSSQLFRASVGLKARYRWCLTGTPIHNSLDDYGALLTFIKVQPFNDKSMSDSYIASPIQENRPRSLQTLKELVRATCLRRAKASPTVQLNLAKPIEKMQYLNLSKEDQEIYEFFRKKTSDAAISIHHKKGAGKKRDAAVNEDNILSLMNILRLICNHGRALLPPKASAAWLQKDISLLSWQTMAAFRRTCKTCGAELEELAASSPMATPPSSASYQDASCESCEPLGYTTLGPQITETKQSKTEEPLYQCSKPEFETWRPSAKVQDLVRNLQNERNTETSRIVTKSVIFSYWTKMLDMIEVELQRHKFTIRRIDGQSTLEARGEALRRFNEDDECSVMLASIGSCGEGVDFTAASNVHIMEPNWSPMAEAQAVDRVHRTGQTKVVTVTRYIISRSIETYVQCVQRDKLALINKSMSVVDEDESRDVDGERWKKLRAHLQDQMIIT